MKAKSDTNQRFSWRWHSKPMGSEAFVAARTVYQYVKTASKTTPGLQSVAEKLGERFKQTKTGEIIAAIKPA